MAKNWRESLFVLGLKHYSAVKIAQQSTVANERSDLRRGFSQNVSKNSIKHSLLTSYKRKQFYSIQSGQSATLQQLVFISKYVWVIDQV